MKTRVNKIKTFSNIDKARGLVRNSTGLHTKTIFMLADPNANDDGYAIVVSDANGHLLKEDKSFTK